MDYATGKPKSAGFAGRPSLDLESWMDLRGQGLAGFEDKADNQAGGLADSTQTSVRVLLCLGNRVMLSGTKIIGQSCRVQTEVITTWLLIYFKRQELAKPLL